MVYYNAYITGEYNALYTPTMVFFIAHLKNISQNGNHLPQVGMQIKNR